MAFITLVEILDAITMSVLIGYIFYPYIARLNLFRKHVPEYYGKRRFDRSSFLFSVFLFGTAVIMHELGHKFVAVAFGYDATFFSAISLNKLVHGLPFFDFASILMIIALVTTYMGGTFFFFIPAYVAFNAAPPPLQTALIAFAGPALNLVLWLVPRWLIKTKKIAYKYVSFAIMTSRINMILFIFNMIPLPGFDGSKILSGLLSLFF